MKQKMSAVAALLVAGALVMSGCSDQGASSDNVQSFKDTGKDSSNGLIPATDKTKIPAAAKNRKDTFIAGISQPEGVFNPYFYHNGWDGNVTAVMFDPLVDVDKSGKPIPKLAESWKISDDNLTYTFKLRPNLKFSDGSPLTAEDVAFTLTILHDKSYDGETDISVAHIKGGDAYKAGKASSIEGIKVIDPQTIQITTEKVNATSLLLLGGPVLSKAYYGKGYKQGHLEYIRDTFAKPMGAGPYKFDEFLPGQEIRFTANENYYAGEPQIKHFIYKITTSDTNFQLFQTGETDYDGFTANADNLDQLKSLGFADINLYTANTYGFIDINHKKPYFKDKRVVQAMFYGLDRKKIVDTFYQGYGEVANEPQSPVSWAYTDKVNHYDYNIDTAKKLLDEAGWKVGADGIREKDGMKFKIDYLGTKSSKINDVLIPIAKENFKDLGIEFDAELMDFNALLAKRKKGDYDMASLSSGLNADPDASEEFSTNGLGNDNGYSDPKVDELLAEGLSTLDIEKRKPIYEELYKELNDNPDYIYLYYRKVLSAHNARIVGLEPDNFSGIISSLPKLKIEQ